MWRSLVLAGWLAAAWAVPGWCAQEAPAKAFEKGDGLSLRGDFRGAIQDWEQAHEQLNDAGRKAALPELLLRKGEALRRLGHVADAETILRQALPLAAGDPRLSASISNTLGTVLVARGAYAEAKEQLDQALASARSAGLARIEAAALNGTGHLHAAQDDLEAALAAYRQSAAVAGRLNDPALEAQALMNAGRAAERLRNFDGAVEHMNQAERAAARLAPGYDRVLVLLSVGELRVRIAGARPGESLEAAHRVLNQALELATANGDRRSQSYAWGYLGQLYILQGRLEDALATNRRAVFAAEQAGAPESLYRWHWQRGRILRAQGSVNPAIEAYRLALTTLQSIRNDLNVAAATGQTSFRESLGPVFFELADLLMQTARGTTDPGAAEKLLLEARDTVELSKAAELEDYFKDSCVAALQAKTAGLTGLDPRTAVIYPILLPDRVELLVSFASGMRQYTVPVEGRAVATVARQFRYRLEERITRYFLEAAQRLHGWLIQPIEADLKAHNVETLVFVPESGLRSIPMAALHDGKDYLVSRYTIAVTPGLTLTDPRPLKLDTRQPETLLTGLSESVQGFPALPDVEGEIAAVRGIQGGRMLLNKQYVVPAVEQEFSGRAFSIVHIASHGEFHGDPKRTFLLTYDGKLTMDTLERMIAPSRFRDQPIELLTLSACETAAGDERAALGLAGIAIKAGARSALASLWSINDESTAMLMEEFYRGLKQGMSKGKALRQAQLKLIDDPRYRHPGYWSPFLLIGNWL